MPSNIVLAINKNITILYFLFGVANLGQYTKPKIFGPKNAQKVKVVF